MIMNFRTLIIRIFVHDYSCDLPHVILICFDIHMIHIWFLFEMQCSTSIMFCTYDCTFSFNLLYPSYYIYNNVFPIRFIWVICTHSSVNTISTSSRNNNMADSARRLQNRITTRYYTTLMNNLILLM